MNTSSGLRIAFVGIVAGTVATGGCAIFDGLLSDPSKKPSTDAASQGAGSGGIKKYAPAEPVTQETQVRNLKATVDAIREAIKQNSTDISASINASLSSSSGQYAVASLYRAMGIQSTALDNKGDLVYWDDQTKQITGVKGPQLDVTVDLSGGGSPLRKLAMTLNRTGDGTTGSGKLSIDAGNWLPFPTPGPASYASKYPSGDPAPSTPPTPTPTPPPFEVAYNQYPDFKTLNKVDASIAVNPKGDTSKHLELSAGAEDFKQAGGILKGLGAPVSCSQVSYGPNGPNTPGTCNSPDPAQAPRIPHHVYSRGKIPKFEYDQSFTYTAVGGTGGEFRLTGDFNLETTKGWVSWSIDNKVTADSARPADFTESLSLENSTYQFKFAGTAKPFNVSPDGKRADGLNVQGTFTSAIDGSSLGSIDYEIRNGQTPPSPKIKLATGEEIELRGQDFVPAVPTGLPVWAGQATAP